MPTRDTAEQQRGQRRGRRERRGRRGRGRTSGWARRPGWDGQASLPGTQPLGGWQFWFLFGGDALRRSPSYLQAAGPPLDERACRDRRAHRAAERRVGLPHAALKGAGGGGGGRGQPALAGHGLVQRRGQLGRRPGQAEPHQRSGQPQVHRQRAAAGAHGAVSVLAPRVARASQPQQGAESDARAAQAPPHPWHSPPATRVPARRPWRRRRRTEPRAWAGLAARSTTARRAPSRRVSRWGGWGGMAAAWSCSGRGRPGYQANRGIHVGALVLG